MDSKRILIIAKNIILILIGNATVAFSISKLILNNGIIAGGVSGIGAVVNYCFGIPVSAVVAVINILLFVLGLAVIGKKFAASTFLSTLCFPFFLELFENLHQLDGIIDDMLLCTLLGGSLIGFGIGLVITAGASTGGIDVLALMINRWTKTPVHSAMRAIDIVILASQFIFRSPQQVIYGIVAVIITSYTMNITLTHGRQLIQVNIISERADSILEAILHEIDAGATLVNCEKGLTKTDFRMIMTVVPHSKLPSLRRRMSEIDPGAFVIVSNVDEVNGNGFTFGVRNQM